jgi:hypothetical protein
MRDVVATVCEVAGSVALVIGAAMAAVCLGWIVGGAMALLWAWRLGR